MRMLLQSSAYNKRVKCDARTSRDLRGRSGYKKLKFQNISRMEIALKLFLREKSRFFGKCRAIFSQRFKRIHK